MKSDYNHIQKLAYSIREACAVSSLGRTTLYNHIAAAGCKQGHGQQVFRSVDRARIYRPGSPWGVQHERPPVAPFN